MNTVGAIKGIHRTSLWNAWKTIRRELKNSSVRDIVDFVEYDINPEVWIDRLLHRLRDGSYEPETPFRFTLAKSKGFSRRMALPAIPDLVLYRAIADALYSRMRRYEHRHVYFERDITPSGKRVAKPKRTPSVWDLIIDVDSEYDTKSRKRFRAWLAYDQYRKYLVFKKVHPFIVVTDITNFFDSILFSRIADSFQAISVPPKMSGLLFFLLERLSLRDAFNESPRIGLPVDEFGCSRKLAHIMLFPHDDRMTQQFGEDAFVRWMDDQNIGVASYSQGMRALATVNTSLARLHLTPNAKKSEILSLSQARRHFHLDLNKLLDKAEAFDPNSLGERRKLATLISTVWQKSAPHRGKGNWDKILKRMYRYGGLAQRRFLRVRAKADLLAHPGLAQRIADYVRCTGSVSEHIDFCERVWNDECQVYGDVNRVLVESLLRLEPDKAEAKRLRMLASRLLKGDLKFSGAAELAALAPLLLLRFGDKRSTPVLRKQFEKRTAELPMATVRASAIVFASYGLQQATALRKAASRLLRNHLSEMVKMLDRLEQYDEVPTRFLARTELSFDSLRKRPYVDMRSVVIARLLGLNSKMKIRGWLRDRRRKLLRSDVSTYDQGLLNRLWPT